MRSVGERGMYSRGWVASSMVLVLMPGASLAGGVSTAWRWVAFRSLQWNKESKLMPDVAFVLLTVALFAALALAVRAVERL
jgi:hypothetical protein